MSFSSFYGGRQGASFVIVKHFDGVDIPTNTTYKTRKLAVTTDSYLIYNNGFIEANGNNYLDYNWELVTMDGTDVVTKTAEGASTTTTITKPIEYAEGMRQCFEQGGDSTDIVNYGEYVIIDTVVGLNQKNNPDNGKIYRRGMNFDYNPTTNPLAGAEYIGQVIGPQGEGVPLDMSTVQDILDKGGRSDVYEPTQGSNQDGIVPGRYIDGGITYYNDNITYGWVTFKDQFGYIKSALIGFTFPYLIEEFEANSITPYENRHQDPQTGKYYYTDLIVEDETQFVDGEWLHPFFNRWKIKIPHGVKGDSQDSLEVYPTFVRAGSTLYSDSALTIEAGTATGIEPVDTDAYDPSLSYVELVNGKFIKPEDGWKTRVRYKQYTYDNVEAGEFQFIDIGPYNIIHKITLAEDGTLTAYYTYDNDTELCDDKLRWIYYDASSASPQDEGIYLEDDGTVVIVYNTMNGAVHETEEHEKAIPWIRSITLDSSGHFKIVYNSDNVSRIMDTTGTETDSQGVTRAIYEAILTTITDAKIDTNGNNGREGDGTQKLNVEYNDSGTFVPLGEPINYVIDTIIVPSSYTTPALRNHLLVYYSDPMRRAASSITTVPFYSNRLGRNVTGWTDLGNVKGEKGTISIVATYPNYSSIPALPPEEIKGGAGTPDYDYAGWGTLYDAGGGSYNLCVYDYVTAQWVDVGGYTEGAGSPKAYITTDYTESLLREDGFVVDITTVRSGIND